MAIATERFTDKRLKTTIDGNWTATRGWDVVGFTTENDAINATGVDRGTPHDVNPDLLCTDIDVVENKFTICRVVATYKITSLVDNPNNPLLRPPVISWRWNKVSQPVDTDLNGIPYLNTVGDIFNSKHNRNFSVRVLTVTRYEPYYDGGTAGNYIDTVNSDSVSILGNGFGPGQMYCLGIAPPQEYQESATYIPVTYQFECRTPSSLATGLTAMQIRHPFQNRVLNQGRRGLYNKSGTLQLMPFHDSSGRPVTHDILLNLDGTPVDSSIKVGQAGLTPAAAGAPVGLLTDSVTTSYGGHSVTANYLIFKDYPELEFNALGIFD